MSDTNVSGSTAQNSQQESPVENQQYQIDRDRIYVIGGGLLINAYALLNTQRFSAAQMLSRIPPVQILEIEEYIKIYRRITGTMVGIVESVPLGDILLKMDMKELSDMRDVAQAKANGKQKKSKSPSLDEMLKNLNIKTDGDIDETNKKNGNNKK
jgi:hypothetical protein